MRYAALQTTPMLIPLLVTLDRYCSGFMTTFCAKSVIQWTCTPTMKKSRGLLQAAETIVAQAVKKVTAKPTPKPKAIPKPTPKVGLHQLLWCTACAACTVGAPPLAK